ncbi:terminase gpA endonuclease subunit [Burkholderia multivorans]
MRSFVNNSQGRPYKYKSDLPELDVLAERALPYDELTVPAGGLLLTLSASRRLALISRRNSATPTATSELECPARYASAADRASFWPISPVNRAVLISTSDMPSHRPSSRTTL